jgi:hypothetical protein
MTEAHSYMLNRASNTNNNAPALEKRFPFTNPDFDFDNIVDYLWHRVKTRYNALCNIQERTEFWRGWCIEQDGLLCLPEFEYGPDYDGGYLGLAFMAWVQKHVLNEIQCIALGKTICFSIIARADDDPPPPQWVCELENMWGRYQEERILSNPDSEEAKRWIRNLRTVS